ncbi:diguanylate cyclase [Oscillospiraceae bacterium LTW-04]|nr:diguanylate cyclase [Oscillospiraceae bacterium MB24-C1]
MPFLQIFFWAMPIVATASHMLLLVIFLTSKRDKAMQYYTFFLASLAVWSGAAVLMRLELWPGVLFWIRALHFGTLLSSLFAYYLVDYYTASPSRIANMFWNAAVAFMLITNCLGLLISQAHIIKLPSINGHPYYALSYTLGPMAGWVVLISGALAVCIFYKAFYYRMQQGVQSAPIRWLVIAIGIGYVGAFSNIFLEFGQYPFDILCCTTSAFIIFFAIFKNRTAEMRFMVVRGITFSALFLLAATLYTGLLWLLKKGLSAYQAPSYLFVSLSALIAAALFQPVIIFIRSLVDRLFYQLAFQRGNTLRAFTFSNVSGLNLSDLSMQLLEAAEKAMTAKHACLLFPDYETGIYRPFSSTMPLTTKDIEISAHSPIIHWVNQNSDCLDINTFHCAPAFRALWEKERQALGHWDIQVAVPIKCRGVLIGLILLTSKQDNAAYTVEDFHLLKDFGASTAAAIDNAYNNRCAQPRATTDDLTGLYNTRYLYQYLPTVVTRKSGKPVSVIIIDVDFFRVYNDLYGHLEGDKALRRIAALIKTTIGQRGICTRYGGEEFTVVLPDYNSASAFKIAEKIRTKVQQMFFGTSQHDRRFLSVSIGMCTYPTAAPSQEELMMRADLALFSAKNSGKNKTVVYSSKLSAKEKKSLKDFSDATPDALIASLNMHSGSTGPAYTATLYALTAAIDTKDRFTFSHSQNVARFASALATKLGMDPMHVSVITEAGLLHDIGKIGIPEQILAKPEPLTKQEYAIMQQHVDMSIAIVKHLPSLNYVVPAIMAHHERWDGQGYPRGLKGDQIPISARCLAIADCFDAIISKRPYKDALPVEMALKEIEACAGTHFDPQIAATFVALVRSGELNVSENNNLPPIVLRPGAV